MNKQERILKFLLGRAISRRDYDEAKQAYEEALSGASNDQKAQAAAYLQSVFKQSVDPKSNKHARHTGAEAYRIATSMLKGTFDPAAVASPLRTTGTLTRRQDYADAGNVAVLFYNLNKDNDTSQSGGTTTSTSSATGTGRYFFDAMNGLNSIGQGVGLTRGDLVKLYASLLLANINGAKNAEEVEHKTVYNKVNGMYDDIATLEQILKDPNSDAAYNSLLNVAGKYDTAEHWSQYFGNLLPQEAQTDTKLASLLSEGYTNNVDLSNEPEYILKLIQRKGLKFLKDKNGNIRAFDSSWDPYSQTLAEWNDDWTIDTDEDRDRLGYNRGLFINDLGNVKFGNIKELDGSEWDELYQKALSEKLKKDGERGNLYEEIDWKNFSNDTEDEFLNKVANSIGKDFKGIDVSLLFSGLDRIIAVNGSGSDFTKDTNGNIRFDASTKFYTLDNNGNISIKNWDDLKDKYKHTGFSFEGKLLGQVRDYSNEIEDIHSGVDLGMNIGDKAWYEKWFPAGPILVPLWGTNFGKEIKDDPQKFSENLLNAIKLGGKGELFHKDFSGPEADDNESLLYNIDYYDNRDKWIEFLIESVRDGLIEFNQINPTLQAEFRKQVKKYMDRKGRSASYEKNGGNIQFAAKGTVVDIYGNEITDSPARRVRKDADDKRVEEEEQAKAEGYKNLRQKKAAEVAPFSGDAKLTTADTLRFATMAQDVASIVASFLPGAGTVAAGTLGVTAMGTDLVADFMDPTVSTGQALWNGVKNLGYAAIGMIPGVKTAKVVRNIAKYAPKILTVASGLGIAMDESTHKTFAKIGKGESLNREDWKNLSHVLSLVAAGTRGGRQKYEKMRINRKLKDSGKYSLKNLENSKSKLFTDEKINEINSELGKINTRSKDARSSALKVLTQNGLSEEEAKAVLDGPMFERLKGGIGKYSIKKGDLGESDQATIAKMWNEEAASLKEAPITTRVANAIGNGAYTAKQRAILNSKYVTDDVKLKLLEYERYNPVIDYRGLRNKAGQITIENTVGSSKISPNTVSSSKISPNTVGSSKISPNTVSSSKISPNTVSSSKISPNLVLKFENLRKAANIKIKEENKQNYYDFMLKLKTESRKVYKKLLDDKTSSIYKKEMLKSLRRSGKFKDGGKVNYQKLRK